MGKGPKRERNIVIKTQFNINGSRGKNVGRFISDYVARDAATDICTAYIPNPNKPYEKGDGVAFTLNSTAITKQETLDLANHVQELFEQGNRAIEQMVISFSPEYLVEQGIVPRGIPIMERGDYLYNYDDVRLRHAVTAGIHQMLENDGYYDGNMVAAIQSDTLHLHVHAVVYEDGNKFTRFHGKEERGMLKDSSLNRLSHSIDRYMETTKDLSCIPTRRFLTPYWLDDGKRDTKKRPSYQEDKSLDMSNIDFYMQLMLEQQKEAEREKLLVETADKLIADMNEELDLNITWDK